MEDFYDLVFRFVINISAMSALIFGLYYRRHGDRTLATTAAMFNVFAFAVLGTLSSVEFGLATGFGLFAILALFNLRSEQIGRIEIAYFFGSIAIAVICSIEGASTANLITIVTFALAGAYVFDNPSLFQGSRAVRITIDHIDPNLLADPDAMKKTLTERLGVNVSGFEIENVNFVNELAVIQLTYRRRSQKAAR